MLGWRIRRRILAAFDDALAIVSTRQEAVLRNAAVFLAVHDNRWIFDNVVLPGDRGLVLIPEIRAQEHIVVMPFAVVLRLDRGVSGIAPTAIAHRPSRSFEQRLHHRMLAAAQPPAVNIDHLQRPDRLRSLLVWI